MFVNLQSITLIHQKNTAPKLNSYLQKKQSMKAVIIDDEKKAREVLAYHLNAFVDNVETIASFDNINNAIEKLPDLDFDLIFLDITMPNGGGFDLIDQYNFKDKLIVFVTAYEEFAVKAFKVSAFDYLLKPIDIPELKRVINKAKAHLATKKDSNQQVIFKAGYDNIVLKQNDISHISSEGNYTTVFTIDNRSFMISKNLKKVAELYFNMLPFLKVHQSHIINLNNILNYKKTEVNMVSKIKIPVSKKGALTLQNHFS